MFRIFGINKDIFNRLPPFLYGISEASLGMHYMTSVRFWQVEN